MNEDELVHEAQRLEEQRLQQLNIKVNFDPFETVQDAKVIREICDEKLGVVRYGALTYKESRECSAIESNEDRTVKTIWLMLKKAYPQLTLEQVEAMPVEKVARLGSLLGERIKSFLPKKTSP